jgi:signal transduction histidine kinase/ligand-binding sensor domain-containing protein
MNRLTAAWTLALSLGLAAPALALGAPTALNEYTRTSWNEEDGMPSSLVWAITQDRDGYLWLGTDLGLLRFDGVRFVALDQMPGITLDSKPVRALCAVRGGGLWIGFGDGGGLGRLVDGRLTTYPPSAGVPERVVAIVEDREGTIWAGGLMGLSRFRADHWERLSTAVGLPAKASVFGIYEDHLRSLWVSTSAGVFRRVPSTDRFEATDVATRVRSFAENGAGEMWVVGPEPASDSSRDSTGWHALTGWRVLRDHHGDLWVATLGQGVSRITTDPSGRPRIERWGGSGKLSSDIVRSVFEDREGNIWVGTQSGLNRLSENTLVSMLDTVDASEVVRAVTAGRHGGVWVGTDSAVYRFDGNSRKRFDSRDGLPAGAVTAIHSDHDGVMWVATDQGHVSRLVNSRFELLPIPPAADLHLIWTVTADFDGGIWLGDIDKGLFRLKSGSLTRFGDAPEIRDKVVTCAMTDASGTVWVGFGDGSVAAYRDGSFRLYSQRHGLAGGGVGAILQGDDGTLWVGTARGVSRLDGDRFLPLTARNSLPDERAGALVQDRQGALWFSVRSGLVKVEPEQFERTRNDPTYQVQFRLYDRSDGLRGLPMTPRGYPTVTRGGDGNLWFVTSSGLAVVNPRHAERDRLPPPVRIEQVIADRRVFDARSHVDFSPLTSNLQIDYTGLSFRAPSKVHFKYQLEGFDKGWTDAGTRRQAFYTNLPPREYRFHVIADNDGVSNDVGAYWVFAIRPTFYQTRWFYALCTVTVVLAVLGAWQAHVRQVQRRFAAVIAERTRVARELHDTLLQSLVGVALQFEGLASDVVSEPQRAETNFNRLRRQIQGYVREAQQSIWDLRSPTLESADLGTALREAGERISSGTPTRFELVIRGRVARNAPRVDEALLRIGQEAVSNAVRHANGTRVRMELIYEPQTVTLRVADDGEGFDLNALGAKRVTHWGLVTMQERAQEIGGEFTLTTAPGHGTTIAVRAPWLGPSPMEA